MVKCFPEDWFLIVWADFSIRPSLFNLVEELLECTCVSSVDHCLACVHVNFHAAVLLAASSSAVVSNGLM